MNRPEPVQNEAHLRKLELELKSRGFSARTIKAYCFHVSHFLKRLSPESPEEEVQMHLVGMAERLDPRTVNLHISAVKFFYRNVLEREFQANYHKKPARIPDALSKEEVRRIISGITNIKHKMAVETIYGCGLRVSEAAKLKKCDIRFSEGLLFVRQGKGKKDRFVSLPATLTERLKAHILLRDDGNPYVFDSARGGHITVATIQKIVETAAKKASIGRRVHPHMFRHSYATHLLENGTDISIIQRLLGHADVKTTQIYTHVSNAVIKCVKSPLDTL